MLRILSSPYPNISTCFTRHNASSFASKIKQKDHLPTKSTEKHEDLSKTISKRPPVVKEKYISVKEFALSYMDFLPSQVWTRRDPLFQKLVHADMLERRMRIDIPEFYVGSIMAVTMSDPNLQQRQNRFVGICIRREKEGLHHNFTLRNVIDGLGVEVMFEIYNPTILKIETLLLEKRLDEDLTYLVDALPEYSTFSFNMESTSHPVGKPVPVNPLKVKLKPPPWLRPWFIYEVNGIEDSFTGSTPWFKRKFLQHADLMCLKRFDIIKHYRQFAQELEISDVKESYFLQLPTIIKSKEDIKIVYYYFKKLFNCSFGRGNFVEFIFNSELIEFLFGNVKISKQFYIKICELIIEDNNIEFIFIFNNLLGEILRIGLSLSKDFMEKYKDFLFKILTNGRDNFREVNLKSYNFLEENFEHSKNLLMIYEYIVESHSKIVREVGLALKRRRKIQIKFRFANP
uniref:Large ribosomal subunit protein bL19m n=1 Tax=Meloidogyne floridensis TaxID=298350 RepID=A0A915P9Q5_9BILA